MGLPAELRVNIEEYVFAEHIEAGLMIYGGLYKRTDLTFGCRSLVKATHSAAPLRVSKLMNREASELYSERCAIYVMMGPHGSGDWAWTMSFTHRLRNVSDLTALSRVNAIYLQIGHNDWFFPPVDEWCEQFLKAIDYGRSLNHLVLEVHAGPRETEKKLLVVLARLQVKGKLEVVRTDFPATWFLGGTYGWLIQAINGQISFRSHEFKIEADGNSKEITYEEAGLKRCLS